MFSSQGKRFVHDGVTKNWLASAAASWAGQRPMQTSAGWFICRGWGLKVWSAWTWLDLFFGNGKLIKCLLSLLLRWVSVFRRYIGPFGHIHFHAFSLVVQNISRSPLERSTSNSPPNEEGTVSFWLYCSSLALLLEIGENSEGPFHLFILLNWNIFADR